MTKMEAIPNDLLSAHLYPPARRASLCCHLDVCLDDRRVAPPRDCGAAAAHVAAAAAVDRRRHRRHDRRDGDVVGLDAADPSFVRRASVASSAGRDVCPAESRAGRHHGVSEKWLSCHWWRWGSKIP